MATAPAAHSTKRGTLSFPITGQAAHSADEAGCLGYIQNPEDVPIIVKSCIVYGVTNSTGAANLTIGNASTIAGAHDRADEFAAAAQAASAGTAVEGLAHGDPADSLPVVGASDYICAFGSASTAGYTGVAYIDYVRVV
jgi:hypothetical protein